MPVDDDSDVHLLARVVARDSAALRSLFERYGGFAYAIAWRVTNDVHLAEDVVQETFLLVWNRASSFDPRRSTNVRGWILAIANHRAIDARRSRQSRQRLDSSIDEFDSVLSIDGHLSQVETIDLRESIRNALESLPESQRRAIELNIIDGFSHAEIATREGLPAGTIKSRIRQGMIKLRARLDQSTLDG